MTAGSGVRYEWDRLEYLLCGEANAKRVLKVDHRQVATYRARGLSPRRADTLAHRAGYHPAEVWPWWGADVQEARRLRTNETKRKWRRTAAGRASERRSQEKWREECREYKRQRDRAEKARLRSKDPERLRAIDRAYWDRNREQINARRNERRRQRKAEQAYPSPSTGRPQLLPGCGPSDPQDLRRRITPMGFDEEVA